MEDLEQSSLEEKVDLGNFVLFPPDSYVNKETGEANFRIKDEPLEIRINDVISENNNIKKETIELPVDEYEKEPIEFSSNGTEMCKIKEEPMESLEKPIADFDMNNKQVLVQNFSDTLEAAILWSNLKTKGLGVDQKPNIVDPIMSSNNGIEDSINNVEFSNDIKSKLECSVCGKLFKSKYNLKFHMKKAHEGSLAQNTKQIGVVTENVDTEMLKSILRSTETNAGQKEKVNKEKKHECSICLKSFKLKYNLKFHIKRAHEKRVHQIRNFYTKIEKIPKIEKKSKSIFDKILSDDNEDKSDNNKETQIDESKSDTNGNEAEDRGGEGGTINLFGQAVGINLKNANPAHPVPMPLDIELQGKNKNEEPQPNRAELSAHGTKMKDFCLENAKSGASRCGVCKEKIKMREVRVGKKEYDSQRAKMYKPYIKWHHVLCFVEKREKLEYFDAGDAMASFILLGPEV